MSNEIHASKTEAEAVSPPTHPMSALAWLYLSAVFVLSLGLIWLAFYPPFRQSEQWIFFGVLAALATVFQFFESQDGRQSYYPHTVFFIAGVILLSPGQLVLLIVLPHLIEWFYKRQQKSNLLREWYIQPFNISTHIIAGLIVHEMYHAPAIRAAVFRSMLGDAGGDVLLAYCAIVGYIVINHALVGQALVLARGISWQESRLMTAENLLTDMVMASLGYILAMLWSSNPWLLIPFFLSLLLLVQALMVPQLRKEVKIDPKTGLLNSKHFQSQLESELQRARRFEHPLALIMADLDLLRQVNNLYGHLAGDAVIQGVAGLIQEHVREYDIAGRFGGEEFAIVLPETNSQEAAIVAERIRKAIEAAIFVDGSSSARIHATMSFGVAAYPGDGDSVEQLISNADSALYQAKYKGRNCIAAAADVPHSERVQRTYVQNAPENQHRVEQMPKEEASNNVEAQPPIVAADAEDGQAEAHPVAPESGEKKPPVVQSPMLWPFVGGTILLASAVTLVGSYPIPHPDWLGIGIFLLLAILAELNQIDLFENNTVSVSVMASFAAAVIAGIPGVFLVSLAIALIHYLKMRPAWYKSLFNWATHLLAALPAVFFFRTLDISLSIPSLPALTLLAIPATLLVYIVETGLMAMAMGLAMRKNIFNLWQERFQWLAINYLILGILGLYLAVGYIQIGGGVVALFILPMLVMYATQKMYVQRTQSSMRELRRMNEELAQANREITEASNEIQRLNDQLFLILAKVIDARDSNVAGHASRVATYAMAVATKLDLPPEQQEYIRQAALLHDIGKLGIPESILYKEGKLSEEEYQFVKQHSEMGAKLLETSDSLRYLAPAIRHHHERWDGKGYPCGLQQEQIPLAARILALCDAVEVMESGRHYESPKSVEEIMREVTQNRGTQFDPLLVDSFVKITQERNHNDSTPSAPPPNARGKLIPFPPTAIWKGAPASA